MEESALNKVILAKASFNIIKNVPTLKINGSPYEMGYQHGFLLADKIEIMTRKTLLATTAYIAAQTGLNFDAAATVLWQGQEAAEEGW